MDIGTMRQTGKVKVYFDDKGFGFIENDNGGEDAFVHIKAVKDFSVERLTPGQKVEYTLEMDQTTNKMRAVNVELIG